MPPPASAGCCGRPASARCGRRSMPPTGSSPAIASRSRARWRRRSMPFARRRGADGGRVNILVCGAQRLHRPGGRPGACAGAATGSSRRAANGHAGGETMAARLHAAASRPRDWAAELRARRIDAVVNCVGILMPGGRRELRAGAHRGADRAVPRRRARRRRPGGADLGARRRRRGRGPAKPSTCAASASPTRPCSASTSTRRSSARRWSSARAAPAPPCSPRSPACR